MLVMPLDISTLDRLLQSLNTPSFILSPPLIINFSILVFMLLGKNDEFTLAHIVTVILSISSNAFGEICP